VKRQMAAMSVLILALAAASAHAQNADGKGISVRANYQVTISIDPAAPMTDVTKALVQANQSLGDLANRECEVLSAVFKSDCHATQINLTANVNEQRRNMQMNNDCCGSQRQVNANLNATFNLTPPSDAAKPAAQ
jgi:hypothetical protein